ncbi:acyl-CoA thioesterase [Ignavibacteria bacterium]|nr:acyl-CoA thioesterase [Bacteroidota bacterium]MCZ2132218.1 acyl-CoA thioesterase [Bacteroidota bacterium]
MTQSSKKPADSIVIMTHLVLPNDTNQFGNLMGGKLMHWIDIAAALVAMRHSGRVCVTASVDEISFLEPIKLGYVVRIIASINRAFRTSMEIGVKVFREDPLNATEAHTSSAYLTFVGIDQYGKPLPAPQVEPETDEERRRYEEASFRREQRLRHRQTMKQMREKR